MNEITPSQAASALAKLSRLNPTRKQIIASRRNGKLGGRPRAKKRTMPEILKEARSHPSYGNVPMPEEGVTP